MGRMGGRPMVGMQGTMLAAVSWLVWMCLPVPAAQSEPSQQLSDTLGPVDAAVPASMPTAKPRASAPSTVSMVSSSEHEASSGEPDGSEPMRISMEFQDANLKDVLKLFSQQTGINVIAGEGVGDQPVTLYLEDVAAMDALDQILRATNLMVERVPDSEIYLVKPKPAAVADSPVSRTIARAYHLRYARVSDSALAKAGAGSAVAGENMSLDGSSGSGGGAPGASRGVGKGIDDVISRLLTSAGTLVVDGRTNSLIITDVPENFPRLEAAITALDVRTPQIMIEAEIIETSLSKAKDLGLKWGSSGDLASFTPGSRQTRFPWNWVPGGRFAPVHTDGDGDPFTLSTLSFTSARGLLQAVETDSDTKILARPKVLTLDNESAVIRLTSDEAIGFAVTTGESSGLSSSEPERETTGVILTVTPQVNEHGYITMLVQPSVTKTVPSQLTTAPIGQSLPRDPKNRSARAVVRIRSGDTLVLGGLIDRDDEQTKTNTPILSGIPFVGELFKHSNIKNTDSELMVFVTPRILDEPSEEKLAANRATPMGLREQEPAGARQETMEQSLNVLEQQQKL